MKVLMTKDEDHGVDGSEIELGILAFITSRAGSY